MTNSRKEADRLANLALELSRQETSGDLGFFIPLRDEIERVLGTKKKCFWPWEHQWSMWENIDIPVVYKMQQAEARGQQRACVKCGYMQLERLSSL